MAGSNICTECGTELEKEKTCQDHFYQMLYWEAENPGLGQVHHLAVLSYYLQHPGLYSQEGLIVAKDLLVDFLIDEVTPQQARVRMAAEFGDNRKPKIKAAKNSVGSYQGPVAWRMTAADVVAGGAAGYCANVRIWARSILESLKASGDI